MTLTTSKILVAVALFCFLVALILSASGGDFGLPALGWVAAGLSSWALATLVP